MLSDGDCGRDFTRIEGICVSISNTTAAKADIAQECAEIDAVPLVTPSAAAFFQIKVVLITHYK